MKAATHRQLVYIGKVLAGVVAVTLVVWLTSLVFDLVTGFLNYTVWNIK